MLTKYIDNQSMIWWNRLTDVELAAWFCKGGFMNDSDGAGSEEISAKEKS
jgi:hypothetical protein